MAANLNANVLRSCRKTIIESLADPEEIIEILRAENVLNLRQYQIVKAETIQFNQVAKLLDFVEIGGDFAFNCFLSSLQDEYGWLKDVIQSKQLEVKERIEETPETNCNTADVPLTEKQLLSVSRQLMMGDWEILGLQLGLPLADVQRCKHASDLPVLQTQEMLVAWKRKNGKFATKQKLQNALDECDLSNINVL